MKFYLHKYKLLLASILAVFSLHNSAESPLNLKEVEEKLLSILPTEIELLSIQKTDIEGFYEVNFQGIEPLFVSSDGNYLVSGDIYLITKEGLINKSESRRDYQRKTLTLIMMNSLFLSQKLLITVYLFSQMLIADTADSFIIKSMLI